MLGDYFGVLKRMLGSFLKCYSVKEEVLGRGYLVISWQFLVERHENSVVEWNLQFWWCLVVEGAWHGLGVLNHQRRLVMLVGT